MRNEAPVQREILKFLKEKGVFCWRVNNMGVPDPRCKGGWRRQTGFGMIGMSDILGIYKKKFLAIEVKAEGKIKNLSEAQVEFLEKVNQLGGIAFVADSVEIVKSKLKL